VTGVQTCALPISGRSGINKIRVGAWRDDSTGPMRVISGPVGKEHVHFEAPADPRLDREMAAFLDWFNKPPAIDDVLKAGLAHFWFVTVHPFDDGNGRIARAIADMALARSEKIKQLFYSMQPQFQRERNPYYKELESCKKGPLVIKPWIKRFLIGLKHPFVPC